MSTYDDFEIMSQLCEEYTGRAWDGTTDHARHALGVQRTVIEILSAHTAWLTDLRARADALGLEWTTSTLQILDDDYYPPPRPSRNW